MGQDYAEKKVCNRMYKRTVEEQGQHGSFKAQVCAQFHNESMLGTGCILFLRKQAGAFTRTYGEYTTTRTFLIFLIPNSRFTHGD